MTTKNPIVRRIELLSDQWGAFRDAPDPRLLCWRLDAHEERMIEAFVAMESDERTKVHPDLFTQLDAPYVAPEHHADVLRAALVAQYESDRAVLDDPAVAMTWQPPPIAGQDPVGALALTCASLAEHHAPAGILAILLRPGAIADDASYRAWLLRLVRRAPPSVRFIVLEAADRPALDELVQIEPERIVTQVAALDMPGAFEEVCAGLGNDGSPGQRFRQLYLQLGKALSGRDLAGAEAIGEAALRIATEAGWHHLAVPVHFALAAALTGAQRTDAGIAHYVAAEHTAQTGAVEGAPEYRDTCRALRLQARLGCGAALITAQHWEVASKHFLATVSLAQAASDGRTELECWRLAAFCEEQSGNLDGAFQYGLDGLHVAKALEPELVQTSNFAFLGEGLLRLCQTGPRAVARDRLEREIAQLAGTPDWRPRIAS